MSTLHQSDLTSPLGPEAQNSHRHLCYRMQSTSQHQSSPVNLSLAGPLQLYLQPCPEAWAHTCWQSWTRQCRAVPTPLRAFLHPTLQCSKSYWLGHTSVRQAYFPVKSFSPSPIMFQSSQLSLFHAEKRHTSFQILVLLYASSKWFLIKDGK